MNESCECPLNCNCREELVERSKKYALMIRDMLATRRELAKDRTCKTCARACLDDTLSAMVEIVLSGAPDEREQEALGVIVTGALEGKSVKPNSLPKTEAIMSRIFGKPVTLSSGGEGPMAQKGGA